jgi:hypothetical protein
MPRMHECGFSEGIIRAFVAEEWKVDNADASNADQHG